MTVTLTTDNHLSRAEMDAIDDGISIVVTRFGRDQKIARKLDLNTMEYID